MKIVTGYRGEAHVTSADVQAYQQGTAGDGILPTGSRLECSRDGDNAVAILDGDGVIQGVHFRVEPGTVDIVEIASGMPGLNRCDIVAARYEKDAETGVESVSWHVIQGQYVSGNPVPDVSALEGGGNTSIWDGDLSAEMPLAYVYISGTEISDVEMVAEVLPSLKDLAAASRITGCFVVAGDPGQMVASIAIPEIGARRQGAKITHHVTLPNGIEKFVAVPLEGGWIGTNAFSFSQSAKTITFYPINHSDATVSNGVFRVLIVPLKEVKR